MVPTARLYLEDYMKIQPGDSRAIIRLKPHGMIESTELEQFEEEMKGEKSKEKRAE